MASTKLWYFVVSPPFAKKRFPGTCSVFDIRAHSARNCFPGGGCILSQPTRRQTMVPAKWLYLWCRRAICPESCLSARIASECAHMLGVSAHRKLVHAWRQRTYQKMVTRKSFRFFLSTMRFLGQKTSCLIICQSYSMELTYWRWASNSG